MTNIQAAQIILAGGAFAILGLATRLWPVVVIMGLAILVGSVIGWSIAANAVSGITTLAKDVLEFMWVVSTHNLLTGIAALAGFFTGAAFKH